MTGNWIVQLEDGMHSIAAELSFWIRRLEISWDGKPTVISQVKWPLGDIHSFERNNHKFVLRVNGPAMSVVAQILRVLGFDVINFALLIDGAVVPKDSVLIAQRNVPPPSI